MREIRMLRLTRRGLETEPHPPPRQSSTLLSGGRRETGVPTATTLSGKPRCRLTLVGSRVIESYILHQLRNQQNRHAVRRPGHRGEPQGENETPRQEDPVMRSHKHGATAWIAAALLTIGLPVQLLAAEPPKIPTWYEDQVVFFTVVSDNVEGVDQVPVSRPLYAFGTPGAQPQFDIIGVTRGDAGYIPWWEAIFVIVLDGRDVSADPYTSEAELLDARDNGRVALIPTGFVFLCQVLHRPNAG